jgi:outer membrane protein assembly factor BamB
MRFNTLTILASTLAAAQAALAGSQPGDIEWRVELDAAATGGFLAVGDDGAVYAKDLTKLYAINPDGSIRWTSLEGSGTKQIDTLANGTIIAGGDSSVTAYDPASGDAIWTFTWDGGYKAQLHAGPAVGPDGNIYGVTGFDDEGGLGAFSLTPQGALRWTSDASPSLTPGTIINDSRVTFADDRFYFSYRWFPSAPPAVFSFSFDGDQLKFFNECTGQPNPTPGGGLVMVGLCGVSSVEPNSGSIEWNIDLGAAEIQPVIASDGTIYTGSFFNHFDAITADGGMVWTSQSIAAGNVLALSEQHDALVTRLLGSPTTIAGLDSTNGALDWTTQLLVDNGATELVHAGQAVISPAGDVAYFTTRFTGLDAPGAVYAIRVGDAPAVECAEDISKDGAVTSTDLNMLLGELGCTDGCTADVTGDGIVNSQDLNAVLAMFGQGCN